MILIKMILGATVGCIILLVLIWIVEPIVYNHRRQNSRADLIGWGASVPTAKELRDFYAGRIYHPALVTMIDKYVFRIQGGTRV